jgi:transposase
VVSLHFPSLPYDTKKAAAAVFGKGNFYRAVGDRYDRLFEQVDLSVMNAFTEKTHMPAPICLLSTIFQYAEHLPDRLAAEAIRTRLDWKYALHLPLNYPGLNPAVLCELRAYVRRDQARVQILQQIRDRLAEAGLWPGRSGLGGDAGAIVGEVCSLSAADRLIQTMLLALEELAACRPEWLRSVMLPGWIERYDQLSASYEIPAAAAEQEIMIALIREDARYLLKAIAETSDLGLENLPEVQQLHRLWRDPYEPETYMFEQPEPCARCAQSNSSP